MSEISDLKSFLEGIEISASSIDVYIKSLSQIGISDMTDLRSKSSVFNLRNIGLLSADVESIMQKMFTAHLPSDKPGEMKLEGSPSPHEENDSAEEFFHRPKGMSSQNLRREEMIVIKQIGHGASGRVFKALFCPTLTFLAVKVYLFSAHHVYFMMYITLGILYNHCHIWIAHRDGECNSTQSGRTGAEVYV
jgi:hypothetical protein